jgi:[ribosomal protein S5]-alanine N-acetyltransferase
MIRPDAVRLTTKRLELVAATLEHVCAELEGADRLASLLNAEVESGWPPGEYDREAQEFFRERLLDGGEPAVGWYGWYAIRRGSGDQAAVVIGAGGYFGPPNKKGEVEIGFSVMPAWEGCGFATEMAQTLVKNAFSDSRVQRVIAHTSPENVASGRVLEKCGFSFVGIDEISGNNLYENMQVAR